MKKILVIAAIALGAVFAGSDAQAQANWEVGVRGGDNFSVEATIPIAAAPRFHPAVYFDRFGIGGYFDWMFALSGGPTGLKFYPGVGPEFWFGNDFDFAAGGDFGAEYAFDFPLTIAFDWRPAFEFTEADFNADRWGFSVRFRFGEGAKFQKAN